MNYQYFQAGGKVSCSRTQHGVGTLREHSYAVKLGYDNFHMKKCDIFLIFAQNIDCGYKLEPPH